MKPSWSLENGTVSQNMSQNTTYFVLTFTVGTDPPRAAPTPRSSPLVVSHQDTTYFALDTLACTTHQLITDKAMILAVSVQLHS